MSERPKSRFKAEREANKQQQPPGEAKFVGSGSAFGAQTALSSTTKPLAAAACGAAPQRAPGPAHGGGEGVRAAASAGGGSQGAGLERSQGQAPAGRSGNVVGAFPSGSSGSSGGGGGRVQGGAGSGVGASGGLAGAAGLTAGRRAAHELAEKIERYEKFIDETLRVKLSDLKQARADFVSEIEGYERLGSSLKMLRDEKMKTMKASINVGCDLYMQAVVPDTSSVMVDIGLGLFAEMTQEEGIAFVEKKVRKSKGTRDSS